MLDEMRVREAAMLYVASCAARSGGVITRPELEAFTFEGEQIKLIDQSRGIRNPRQLEATISILTQLRGPYDDEEIEGGRLHYAYRTGSTESGDKRTGPTSPSFGRRCSALTSFSAQCVG